MTLAPAPRLMPFDLKAEHQTYRLKSGEIVIGASTIVRATLPSPTALLNWYRKMGAAGEDPKAIKETAGDIGSVIHGRIEAWLRGFDGLDPTGIPPEMFPLSWPALERFMQEWTSRSYAVIATEHQMVSEDLRCGGTLDVMAETPDGLVLVDIKSVKKYYDGVPYESHRIQSAGYLRLWRETDGRPVERVEIWRTGKSAEDPGEIHRVRKLEAHVRAFETAVAHFHALRAIDAV